MISVREERGFARDGLWAWGMAASVLLHLILVLIILYGPMISLPGRHEDLKILDISLLGVPDAGPAPGPEKPAAAPAVKAPASPKPEKLPEPAAEPEPEPEPEPAAEPVPTPEAKPVEKPVEKPTGPPQVKTALKKKSFNQEAAVKSALAKMAGQAEEDRSSAIEKALESARRMAGVTATGGGGAPGMPGGRQPTYLEEYLARVQEQVNRNWAYPERLTGTERNLEAVVMVTIEKDGSIKEMWFEKRSGNTWFDESAQRAVVKSNPVPPLPDKYPLASLPAGLVFRPPN